MQQANERQRQVRRDARHYGQLIGYAGGIFAVLQVSAGGAAAYENLPTELSLQRSLVNLSLGGGANPLPSLSQLGPMWTLAGVMCLVIFCVTLWLCGVAGRLAAIATGERSAGRSAGSRAALVTSGIWIVASLLAAGVFHADGGFSWLFATIAVLMFSSAAHVPGVLLTSPSSQFLIAHLAILTVTHLIALLITWGFGALAGGFGASTVPNYSHRYFAPGVQLPPPGLPPYAAPIYLPPQAAPYYPPQAAPYYPPAAYPQYPQQQQPQYQTYQQYPRYPLYPFYQQHPPAANPPKQDAPPAENPPAPPAE